MIELIRETILMGSFFFLTVSIKEDQETKQVGYWLLFGSIISLKI